MPDSRDSASQRAKGRMSWDDDDVEIRDLDPALDLDVFADDGLTGFGPATPEEATPPHQRVADGSLPLPEVVRDEEIAVPQPSPVVVKFPRTASNPELQDLASGSDDPPPAYARAAAEVPPTQPSRLPAGPKIQSRRRTPEYLPIAAAAVIALVAIVGAAYEWSRRAKPSVGAPVSLTASRDAPAETPPGPKASGTVGAGAASNRRGSSDQRKSTSIASTSARRGGSPAAPGSTGGGSRNGAPRTPVPTTSAASSVRPSSGRTSPAARSVDGAVATAGRAAVATPFAPAASERPPKAPAPPRDANGAIAGWLRVDAASELQLTVDGVGLGSTRQAPLLVAAGTHTVELASDRAGVHTTARVTVAPGQVAVLPITLPQGTLSVTAQPDADVFVDGQPAGRTPVDHIALTVGVRRILVRHPQFGERSYEIVVREGRQTQLSVDLRPQ